MSTVTLSIGPKSYSIACADGQESHITALGAMIAEKYAQLGSARAPLEAQNLLFAGLFMADELAEARKQLAAVADAPPPPAPDTSEADGLRETIARLESELVAAHAAALLAESRPEPVPADLFDSGSATSEGTEALADQLEALAARIEASAAALEAGAANA